MRRIFATDFGIWPAFQNVNAPADQMVTSADYRSRLANYILLYDQIIIPTGNYYVASVLRLVLGEDIFDELITRKIIVLARYNGWFAYAGGGAGIRRFSTIKDPTNLFNPPNIATSFYESDEQAVDTLLVATNPQPGAQRKLALKKIILDNSISMPTDELLDGLATETYADVRSSPYLRDMLRLDRGKPLEKLKGIKRDQITAFNPHMPPGDQGREIRAVLRVAFENFLLRMGKRLDLTEMTGDNDTHSVIRGKAEGLGMTSTNAASFTRVQEAVGVRNLGVAFANRHLAPRDLLTLRDSENAEAMRSWFAAGSPHESADSALQRYAETISHKSWFESLPIKWLRFALTNGIGLIDGASGVAASIADMQIGAALGADKISPRLFLEDAKVLLGQMQVVPPPVVSASRVKGRDRNAPCYCGSGLKTKSCHGS